jgi:hypothetical protein
MDAKQTGHIGERLAILWGLLWLGALLGGCRGTPTEQEHQARQQVRAVAAVMRPNDQGPALPPLTAQSGLDDFLTFAMLNQPRVVAAYYEWVAAVERITTARSFPDPQLTFQMDIQNIVTSIMPGLMGSIPWPSRLRAGAEIAWAESRAKYFNFQSAVL